MSTKFWAYADKSLVSSSSSSTIVHTLITLWSSVKYKGKGLGCDSGGDGSDGGGGGSDGGGSDGDGGGSDGGGGGVMVMMVV